jgi:hypothetical protein
MKTNYSTQNIYEAAFLLTKGFNVAGKESTGNKVNMLFEDSPDLQKEILNFYNGGKIQAKALFDSYRTLKDYIFKR